MKARHLGYAAGAALVLWGMFGLVSNAGDTHPVGWALWFGGAALAHDLIAVPVVLAVAAATTRVPAPYRLPLQAVLVVAGGVAVVGVVPVLT